MTAARAYETVDRRVLGAVTFVDPLGRRVATAVAVNPVDGEVKLFAKRPGEIVITAAPRLAAHTAAFDQPPPVPALGKVEVVLDLRPSDPGLGARRVTLKLPRNPDAAKPDNAATAVVIPLLAAASGTSSGLAAAVRITVRRDDGAAIEGAIVRLRPDGHLEVRAITDAAGDALLLALGVPLASPGAGATVEPDIGGVVDAIVDPALARFHASADIMQARRDAGARQSGFIDPDDVIARLAARATVAVTVRVAAGRTTTAAISWTAP